MLGKSAWNQELGNIENPDQGTDTWQAHTPNGHTITDSPNE